MCLLCVCVCVCVCVCICLPACMCIWYAHMQSVYVRRCLCVYCLTHKYACTCALLNRTQRPKATFLPTETSYTYAHACTCVMHVSIQTSKCQQALACIRIQFHVESIRVTSAHKPITGTSNRLLERDWRREAFVSRSEIIYRYHASSTAHFALTPMAKPR